MGAGSHSRGRAAGVGVDNSPPSSVHLKEIVVILLLPLRAFMAYPMVNLEIQYLQKHISRTKYTTVGFIA
jgi:hypothetical protein